MERKIYNKLIRDKIPEIIEKNGGVPGLSTLSDAEFRKALKEKVLEEAKELLEAESDEDILNELADVEELVWAVAKEYGISMEDIENKREKKLQERGGFEKKLFLEHVDE